MTPRQAREYQATGALPEPRSAERAAQCVRAARAKWGDGWAHLSPEQRAGAVPLQVAALLVGQDEESAPPAVRRLQHIAERAIAQVTP